jgi:hypothetical protein
MAPVGTSGWCWSSTLSKEGRAAFASGARISTPSKNTSSATSSTSGERRKVSRPRSRLEFLDDQRTDQGAR